MKLATQHAEFAFPWELWSRVGWASRAVLVEFCAQHSSDVAFSTFRFFEKVHGNTFLKHQNGNIWSEPGVGGGEGAALRTSFATFSAKHLLRLQVWNLNFIEAPSAINATGAAADAIISINLSKVLMDFILKSEKNIPRQTAIRRG